LDKILEVMEGQDLKPSSLNICNCTMEYLLANFDKVITEDPAKGVTQGPIPYILYSPLDFVKPGAKKRTPQGIKGFYFFLGFQAMAYAISNDKLGWLDHFNITKVFFFLG
jgi:hypothetical protein